MRGRVFVLGSFAVDAVYRSERMPSPGETLLGRHFQLGPGGKGSNQAIAAARAGAEVALLTATGPDMFGEFARFIWCREGIDQEHIKASTVSTGAAAILVDDESGENAIVVVPGASGTLSPEDVDRAREAITAADVFLAQLEIPIDAVQRGLEIARSAGVTTILNPAPAPAAALPKAMLGLVDYLIPNEAEAKHLAKVHGCDMDAAPGSLVRNLRESGSSHLLITMGGCGSVLCEVGREARNIKPVAAGRVVDTTGAGDAFCGAFATLLAEGRTGEEAALFASAAAGISVTRHGAALSTPSRAEIGELLRRKNLVEALRP